MGDGTERIGDQYVTVDEYDRLEGTVQRLFARVSALEAKVAALERDAAIRDGRLEEGLTSAPGRPGDEAPTVG